MCLSPAFSQPTLDHVPDRVLRDADAPHLASAVDRSKNPSVRDRGGTRPVPILANLLELYAHGSGDLTCSRPERWPVVDTFLI